jgi:carbamoyl-phosphate synthase small subunit
MSLKLKSRLILETGEEIEGLKVLNEENIAIGKVVFDTRVVGYEKILSCPEYKDKLVCFSYPLVGNYGINYEDLETKEIFPAGLIISELSSTYSNYRADSSFFDFISKAKMSIISQVDTQYITKKIREENNLWGAIVSSDIDTREVVSEIKRKKVESLKLFSGEDASKEIVSDIFQTKEEISVLNLGIKKSEITNLQSSGYKIKILNLEDDNILKEISSAQALYITSGSENYSIMNKAYSIVRELVGKLPIFGTGLGHLILGQILGGKILEDCVNHYGINLPVVNLVTEKNLITEQMHSFVLDKMTIPEEKITYLHLNDKTIEGLTDKQKQIISVSFIPQEEDFQSFFSIIKEQNGR